MHNIRFYTTQSCHLCEQAMEWFVQLGADKQFVLEKVDIVVRNDPALIADMGDKIPVFEREIEGKMQRLYFPFSLLDLQLFLCKD